MGEPRDAELRRQDVLRATQTRGEAATGVLITALTDDDAIVREWAIEGLLRRKDGTAAVPDLLRRLRDERADVRWYAARALGKLGDRASAVGAGLVAALHDVDAYVRAYAAWAIGVLGMRDHLPALRAHLREQPHAQRGLEAMAIGLALARLHTDPRPDDAARQSTLFDLSSVSSEPSTLPKTSAELIQADLERTAERIVADRVGGAVTITGSVRLTVRYARSVALKEQTMEERGRRCQLCGFTFQKANGDAYAECHHLMAVSQGGPDHPDNLLVLCPNHHKALHYAAVQFPGGMVRPPVVVLNGDTLPVAW